MVARVRHLNDRRRVGDVPVHRGLRRVVEERGHTVKFALRDRVELVVVADGATGGQAHPHLVRRLGPVPRVQHEIFLGNRAAFVRRDVATVEPRRDFLIDGRVRQQVARQLLDRELIEFHVGIEGINHPVAVRPHLAGVVEVDAVRVRIARRIEPVTPAVFAPMHGGHELIDVAFVVIGGFIVDEFLDRRRVRWQADEIERKTPCNRASIRFGGGLQAALFEFG